MQPKTEKTVVHIYNDVAFKWLFGREKESRPLTKLLNAVVAHDGLGPGFSEIEIKNPYDESQPLSKQRTERYARQKLLKSKIDGAAF
ncbi:MAG: hypothetical protein OMM_06966 [Candidatus Magnetoglobus multicellularis str. Araruama]|uniref:Uncharacterized protein n=1 Tax=Candidatus Magnetoglobus multicellularis str. Araruama TaxID=890399 RepID=A0A1V1PER3_9BACT|nr:MAG: hypothetical protein OMM_06966 [Candidatus Magnetoglobus multicellularis str. Araruama]